MDYVVLDLEWNQASDSRDARNRLLTFEIIEIGAVKLNSRMEIVGTFEELIRPQVYDTMHHITEKLIGIHMKDLSGCRTFAALSCPANAMSAPVSRSCAAAVSADLPHTPAAPVQAPCIDSALGDTRLYSVPSLASNLTKLYSRLICVPLKLYPSLQNRMP